MSKKISKYFAAIGYFYKALIILSVAFLLLYLLLLLVQL